MSGNLILGCATMALCLAIQCVIVSIMLRGLLAVSYTHLTLPTN